MKRKFDAATAKKIINDYAEKLNFYIKENTNLISQLEDTKTTLSINKDLLFKYISQSKSDEKNKLFKELQDENTRLQEKTSTLFGEKTFIEKKLYKTQQELEDRIISDKEIIDKANEYIFLLENKLKERELMISHLKDELEKYYRNDIIESKEIFLADPDRINLELYNELNYGRDFISKVTRMLNQEKTKNTNLEEKLKEYEEKIHNLKKGKKISKNMDKISILDYITSSEEENEEDDDDDHLLNLESPIVKFPEKIKMEKGIFHKNKSFTGILPIPKLDLTGVKAKYHNPKNVEVEEVCNFGVKNSNRSSNEYIEKLKFQMKVCKNTIKAYRKKIEKYKRIFEVQKKTIMSFKNKNELLEMQLKKSTVSTNDEKSNKKDIANTSMNNNTSVRYEEYEDDDNDEDFNYVVREYNKSVVNTTECK